jgi:peptidyl-prolyl cis-trans isomerase D
MLKTMRKNVQSLKWVLWVVVATFILSIFFIWGLSGEGPLGKSAAANTLASVGRERITGAQFTQALRSRIESLKTEFKEINRSFIEQLQVPQQVLQQLVEQSLLSAHADEMGIRASDEEVAAKVMSFPGLQKDGKFIGVDEYKQRLKYNRINLSDFEQSLRREIVLTKTVQILTAGVTTTPDEVWDTYKKSKDSAKIEYLALEKSKVEVDKKPEAAEIRAYFEKSKDKYKIPEKREATYVFLKNDDLKKEIELSEPEIEKYYKDNQAQFQIPEKVKVSRIFLPFAGKDKALVEAEARTVQAKIKAGDDFAALAKTYSKDDKAKDGGDWGFYDCRNLAKPEQDEVAKLAAGKVSDTLTQDTGISFLKVIEKDAAATTPLASAKPQIRSMLQDQKARQMATERITLLGKEAKQAKNLEAAAKKANYKTASTGLLKSGQGLGDFDPSGSISTALFQLKEKDISAPIYSYGGVALAQMNKSEAPRPAAFDEVKADVEKDVIEVKKKDAALSKIKEARAKLTDKNWEDIAQKYKLEIKTVDDYKKEQYIGIIGENKEIDALAFGLPLKQVSEPVAFENGYALVRVLDRKEATKADFEKDKETEKNTLLETKKNKFLQSYVAKLRTEKGVKVKYDLYLQITQDILSRYEKEK